MLRQYISMCLSLRRKLPWHKIAPEVHKAKHTPNHTVCQQRQKSVLFVFLPKNSVKYFVVSQISITFAEL